MNDKEEFFKEGFTELSYFNVLKGAVNAIYDELEPNKGKKLDFMFSTSGEVNASAGQNEKGEDCMKLNVGTLIRIYSHMKNVFANKYFFTMVGDVTKEVNEGYEKIRGWFDNASKRLWFTGNPIDEKRRYVSDMCALIAIRFICTHELGHLYNGHIALMNTLYSIPESEMIIKKYCYESNIPRLMETYALDSRTIEMDADAYAATASMMNISQIYMHKDDKEWRGMFESGLPKTPLLFKLWAFAVQSVFLIFQMEVNVDYSKDALYLPNEARTAMAFSAAMNTLNSLRDNEIFICSKDEFLDIIENISTGIEEANRYFSTVHFTHFHIQKNQQEYIYFIREVHEHWENVIRNKLKKYARITLYSPDTINEVYKQIKNVIH